MNGMIQVECDLCGLVAGMVPENEILAGVTVLNGHLADCTGERTILTDDDRAKLARLARENLR